MGVDNEWGGIGMLMSSLHTLLLFLKSRPSCFFTSLIYGERMRLRLCRCSSQTLQQRMLLKRDVGSGGRGWMVAFLDSLCVRLLVDLKGFQS